MLITVYDGKCSKSDWCSCKCICRYGLHFDNLATTTAILSSTLGISETEGGGSVKVLKLGGDYTDDQARNMGTTVKQLGV